VRTPIRAALLTEPGKPLSIETVLLDEPEPHEVLVRTERVGVCHSDLHYVDGSLQIELPAVLGHEVAGTVERVGAAVTRVAPGDRVVATVTPSCGLCSQCLRGRPTQCSRVAATRTRQRPRLTDANEALVTSLGGVGAFAEAFLAPETSVATVPQDVPPEVACLLGCCISTGVGAVVHGCAVTPEDTVVVIGCGGVGIAAIQGARLAGARRILAVDTAADKLDLARRFGATDTLVPDRDHAKAVAQLKDVVPNGFDHAIEAVGLAQTAELAFGSLAPTGTATILGLMPEGEHLSIPADDLVYGDRRLQGAYMGANRFLSDVNLFVDHYRTGRLDLDGMVTAQLGLTDVNDAFTLMAAPTTVRIVLDPSRDTA
jgi:S-(hydroxymethyl)glutathione dehydrogenase/alcohol dehydrogenase